MPISEPTISKIKEKISEIRDAFEWCCSESRYLELQELCDQLEEILTEEKENGKESK